MIGIHGLGAPLAGVVTPVAVSWIGVRYGWRPAMLFIAAVGVPVWILFYALVRPPEPRRPQDSLRERFEKGLLRDLLSRRPIRFTVWIASVEQFLNQGLLSFLPTFFVEYHGYSTTRAGAVFSGFFLVIGVSGVSIGAISDRYGRDGTITACMLLAALGSLLLLAESSERVIWLTVVTIGIGASNVTAVQPRFLDWMTEDEQGTGFGLVRTVYVIVGALGSVTVGFLADVFGWAVSFGFLAALCLLVAVGLFVNWQFGYGY